MRSTLQIRPTRGTLLPYLAACLLMFGVTKTAFASPTSHRGPEVTAEQYTTAHIALARPLDGPAIKTLFIIPRAASRDAYELMQRISLDATVFETPFGGTGRWQLGDRSMFGWERKKYAANLLYDEQHAKLQKILEQQDFDLIVLGNFSLGSLPLDLTYALLKRVTEGAGLVVANAPISGSDRMLRDLLTRERWPDGVKSLGPLPIGDHLIEAINGEGGAINEKFGGYKVWNIDARDDGLTPIDALTYTKPYDIDGDIKTYRVKSGRMVHLAWEGEGQPWRDTTQRPGLVPGIRVNLANAHDDDLYYAAVAKACMWAAGREPRNRLTSVEVDKSNPLGEPIEVGVTMTSEDSADVTIRAELFDALTGQPLALREQKAAVSTGPPHEATLRFDPVVPGRA